MLGEPGAGCWAPNALQVAYPYNTTSNWGQDSAIILVIQGEGCDYTPLIDDTWREAIKAVLEIEDVETREVIPYEIEQDTINRGVHLAFGTPLDQNAAYRLTLRPGSIQTAVKDLKVFSDSGNFELTGAPECVYLYTQSRPVIAGIGSFPSEFGDIHIDFTISEWLRREDIAGAFLPQLRIDGIDRTICYGPPSCCITGTTADGGMNPETPCEMGGGRIEDGGETVDVDGWFYFVVPSGALSLFSEIEIRLATRAHGKETTVAEAIEGIKNTSIDGEWVVWTFPRSEFRGAGDYLTWTPPCE